MRNYVRDVPLETKMLVNPFFGNYHLYKLLQIES